MADTSNPFFEEPKKPESKGNFIVDILQSIVIAVSLSIFLYLFIITPNEVDGDSMLPNFHTGELLFTSKLHKWLGGTNLGDKLGFDYNRGDVIVFQKPGLDDFVKRIIAEPGDTIAIEDGRYVVNGETLDEEFTINNAQKRDGNFLEDGDPAKKIPDDYFFVSGDNRDVSFDSRELGFIKREWIKGKVILRFWPLDKFGYIEQGKFDVIED